MGHHPENSATFAILMTNVTKRMFTHYWRYAEPVQTENVSYLLENFESGM